VASEDGPASKRAPKQAELVRHNHCN